MNPIVTVLPGFQVSRPAEFYHQPLAEPYVTLSRHTAPIARAAGPPKTSQ
jgi:hypothetical protein